MQHRSLLYLIIHFSLFFSCLNALAQHKLKIGPTTGLGLSSMSVNYERTHFRTGIIANYEIFPKLNIEPALLVSTKGFNQKWIGPDKSVNLKYIDLTVSLKYQPGKLFFIGGGVQAGYLWDANYKGSGYTRVLWLKPYAHKLDYGLNAITGIQFSNGIGLELSYTAGLRKVIKPKYAEAMPVSGGGNENVTVVIPHRARGKNSVVALSFYFLFNTGNKDAR